MYVLEGLAERLGMPVHVYIQVRKADDKQVVATIDSHPEVPDKAGQFFLFTKDPKGRSSRRDGDYQVVVTSHTAHERSGPRFVYRVNLRREEPNFRLILVANVHRQRRRLPAPPRRLPGR